MTTNGSERIQNPISRLLEDPLAGALLESSQLSKIQLETLLIDILSEEMVGKQLKYEEKAKFRQTDKKISRGAFNRTLKQAKRNVNKSINTVLLLGYLGILESPQLEPFIELSNRLNRYVKTYAKLWKDQKTEAIDENKVQQVLSLKKELEKSLKELTPT